MEEFEGRIAFKKRKKDTLVEENEVKKGKFKKNNLNSDKILKNYLKDEQDKEMKMEIEGKSGDSSDEDENKKNKKKF